MINYHLPPYAFESLDSGKPLMAGGEDYEQQETGPIGDIVVWLCRENRGFSIYTHIQTRWDGRLTDAIRQSALIPVRFGENTSHLDIGGFSQDNIIYSFNTLETIVGRVELYEHKSDVICTALNGTFDAGSQEELEHMIQIYAIVANQFYTHFFDKSHAPPAREMIFREIPDKIGNLMCCLQTVHYPKPSLDPITSPDEKRAYFGGIDESDGEPNQEPFDDMYTEVKWQEIGGFKRQKEQVMLFVDNWLDPESVRYAGLEPEKAGGMLFLGPSGWGKSMFADAAATYASEKVEKDVYYLFRSYGRVASIFRGGEAISLREDFRRIKGLNDKGERVIYFFEEVQSVGERNESSVNKSGNELLDQLLVELTRVDYGMTLVMASTARDKSKVDPQLLRPGRLGEHVYFSPPITPEDASDIVRAIIEKNIAIASSNGNNEYISEGIDYSSVGSQMTDFSPADIDKAIREALNPKMARYRKERIWVPFSTEDILAGARIIRARRINASVDVDRL
jgi:hypothetical protein